MRQTDRRFVGDAGPGSIAYPPAWAYGAGPAAAAPPSFGTHSPRAPFRQHYTSPAAPAAEQADVGGLFRELRRVLGFTPVQAAQLLNTRPQVISALEAGDVSALPAWSETVRVVTAYTGLVNINAVPVLSLMQVGLTQPEAGAAATKTEMSPAPVQTPPEERKRTHVLATLQPLAAAFSAGWHALSTVSIVDLRQIAQKAGDAALAAMRRNARRTALLVAALFVIIAYFGQGSSLQASLATLQPPIAKLMRSAQVYLLERAAPSEDGFKWIEVDDPRSRRTDKLASKPD